MTDHIVDHYCSAADISCLQKEKITGKNTRYTHYRYVCSDNKRYYFHCVSTQFAAAYIKSEIDYFVLWKKDGNLLFMYRIPASEVEYGRYYVGAKMDDTQDYVKKKIVLDNGKQKEIQLDKALWKKYVLDLSQTNEASIDDIQNDIEDTVLQASDEVVDEMASSDVIDCPVPDAEAEEITEDTTIVEPRHEEIDCEPAMEAKSVDAEAETPPEEEPTVDAQEKTKADEDAVTPSESTGTADSEKEMLKENAPKSCTYKNKVDKKSVTELGGMTFVIPSYQRGFRWTGQQMKDLLNDLYEFSQDGNRKAYSLQPIVVRQCSSNNYPDLELPSNDVYEVIDGQQRLTALWTLFMWYYAEESIKVNRDSRIKNIPVYSIRYEGKKGFDNTVQLVYNRVSKPSLVMNSFCDIRTDNILDEVLWGSDIDSVYLKNAFKHISDNNIICNKTKTTYIFDVFPKKDIQFIWYEIDSSATSDYIIDKFTNINANKIPLTESELIKAYFLGKLDEGKKGLFTAQWEQMERDLSNDTFWAFFMQGRDIDRYETRMTFLFEVKYGSDDSADKHGLSRKLFGVLTDPQTAWTEWSEIKQLYDTLMDWYRDFFWYHMIGLYVETTDEKSSKVVIDLYKKYGDCSKSKFAEYLKKRIRNRSALKLYEKEQQKGKDKNSDEDGWQSSITDCSGIFNGNEEFLRYGNSDAKSSIKSILLLFNVALRVNAYKVCPDNQTDRFPFDYYKNKENPLEIEHISPQNPQKEQKTHETLDDCNELSNLTLLDKGVNGSYGNSDFQTKRSRIIAAMYGLEYQVQRDDGTQGMQSKVYGKSVILPGTAWVFLRQYADDKVTNMPDTWTKDDRDHYLEFMKQSIFKLLN